MDEANLDIDTGINDILNEFIAECTEMLDEAEPEMLSSSRIDQDLANKIFRPLHSMKGVAGSFGLNTMAQVAHASETFLSIFRNGETESDNPDHLQIFLKSFDFFRSTLCHIQETGSDTGFEQQAQELIAQFESTTESLIQDGLPHEEEAVSSEEVVQDEIPKIEISQEMLDGFRSESLEAFDTIEQSLMKLINGETDPSYMEETFRLIHSFKGNCGIFALRELEKLSHKLESFLDLVKNKKVETNKHTYELVIQLIDVLRESVNEIELEKESSIQGIEVYLEMLEEQMQKADGIPTEEKDKKLVFHNSNKPPSSPPPPSTPASNKKITQQDLRVSTYKLDTLNDLVGELVTAKTMVFENIKSLMTKENDQLEKAVHFLEKTITDLQDITMEIRMIPINGLFKKMVRIVHDLSAKSHKKIDLQFSGEDTEVDKTLIEKISDPLVHMIRNSVDHGIEPTEERIKAGKPEAGQVTIGAKQESSEVWIIIQDDGRGLDREKILSKAMEQEIVSGDCSTMSDEEVFQLIYRPGFSTAEQITDISGRGVGMDVVTQNIKEVKGRISIESKAGEGSTFTIKIPLTLAIIDGMLMKVGNVKYVLSVDSIQEIVKVSKSNIKTLLNDQELIPIRGELIPVVCLSELHNHPEGSKAVDDGVVLIIHGHGHKIGLLIDELLGQQQTVVKPLSNYFEEIKGVSSCSVLGNGEVSLILDVASLVELALEKIKQ